MILYAPEDIFRIACLAVGDVEHCPVTRRVRPKVFTMIRYCHSKLCRRISFQKALETSHLPSEDSMEEPSTCLSKGYQLCDNCRRKSAPVSASSHDREAIQLIFETIKGIIVRHEQSADSRENKSSLTLNKLMNTTEMKGLIKELKKNQCSLSSDYLPASPPLYDWEYLVVTMIERSYLDLSVHFTPYSTICYIASGERKVSSGALLEYDQIYYLKLPSSQVMTRATGGEVRVRKRSKKRVVEVEEEEDEGNDCHEDKKNKTEKARNQHSNDWIDLTNE